MIDQSIHKLGVIVRSVLLLLSLQWNALYGQLYPPCFRAFCVHRLSGGTSWREVPVFPPEAGTVPIYDAIDGSTFLDARSVIDSLELRQLEIEIRRAEERVSHTTFFQRLLPEIHISGSLGIGNLLFIDPTSAATYVMPNDAYRLSVSLSLSELLNSSKHSEALLQLEALHTRYQHRKLSQMVQRQALHQELLSLDGRLRSLEAEAAMIQDLIHFNRLRFDQGKIEYDALVRTKLELSSLNANIDELKHQRTQLLLKLQQGQ